MEFLAAMFQKIEVFELLKYSCQDSGREETCKLPTRQTQKHTLPLKATQFVKNVRARAAVLAVRTEIYHLNV